MGLHGKNVLLTGASMGIGEAIATALAAKGANLVLLSRSEERLSHVAKSLSTTNSGIKVIYRAADIGNFDMVDKAVGSAIEEIGDIDILINNAGLALGAPARFPDLKIEDIITMSNTNINGIMFVTHSVLNRSMMKRNPGKGTILNVTSVTAHEVPPFPGEAVYHASKAFQEGFTNSLRNELVETDIKVLAIRPGVVATHFHTQRVGFDQDQYDSFVDGYDPLVSDDVAQAAVYMLEQPETVSIKALDVVPTAQRSLTVFDRTWSQRSHQ
ncbi:NADP-dependent L-serine/L-allo-threonine dehydrogenase ydfG [Colletotrichum godetiae]|uniref:NADP-dependent L-serine/L-allo-threonine dehydrogenase ydfG n=1 Tax=Colletotrichum godetiae TaxID=1209918 RepID=A0AAJ0AD06_9PEZI|nr:NADP-dependent L-serine/L-allo-threonine dehydrogenase ydfG [Colletotrichum godetiae]KAK1671673.1 NADP-dependent L-serine/L-allo-threonine dehydrogenase ydfG [Colletotrichum godetiae]